MSALRAHSMNNVLNGLYFESLGYMYLGDSFVFEAIGFATNRACEMYMLA